jgi:hypothetical protein
MGVRRKDIRFVQHNACCFGINHWTGVGNHQLYMLDVADPYEGLIPGEEAVSIGDELVQHEGARMVLKRRRPQYFDKRQQLDLVLVA